jgi:hydrogenase/urease accessory protein HupE
MPLFLAHLVSTGVGPFYDGAAHFFVSLEEILPVLALALLGGLRGPRAGRWLLAVLPAAWIAGGLAGLSAPATAPRTLVTFALLLVPATLVAADRKLPLLAIETLAALIALWTGFANGTAMGAAGTGALAVVGAASGALLLATLVAALAAAQRSGWPRVALRVAGSWIAALALLSLGWTLKA